MKRRDWVLVGMEIAAIALIAIGAGMIFLAAAPIVAGLGLLTLALAAEMGRGNAR